MEKQIWIHKYKAYSLHECNKEKQAFPRKV